VSSDEKTQLAKDNGCEHIINYKRENDVCIGNTLNLLLTSKKLIYEMVVVWHGINCSTSLYWLCLLGSLALDLFSSKLLSNTFESF